MKIRLIMLVGFMLLLLGSGVYALNYSHSEPALKDSPPISTERQTPIKADCPRDEWNWAFEEYRAGNIPKDDMIEYVASCNY